MAKIVLCDRCGAVIKTPFIKHVSFEFNPSRITVYDLCDKCYDELEEYMKINKEEQNA